MEPSKLKINFKPRDVGACKPEIYPQVGEKKLLIHPWLVEQNKFTLAVPSDIIYFELKSKDTVAKYSLGHCPGRVLWLSFSPGLCLPQLGKHNATWVFAATFGCS